VESDDEPVTTPEVLQARVQDKVDEQKKQAAAISLVSVTELGRQDSLVTLCPVLMANS
jgi:hypothetical protein